MKSLALTFALLSLPVSTFAMVPCLTEAEYTVAIQLNSDIRIRVNNEIRITDDITEKRYMREYRDTLMKQYQALIAERNACVGL